MRTKRLLCLAALTAAGVATSMAQSNVYSLNVVGYYNRTVTNNHFALLGNQLNTTNNQIQYILASVPAGTAVLTWNGAGFSQNTLDPSFGWDVPDAPLNPGTGFFVHNTAPTNFTITFVGEVLQNTNANAFTQNVYKLVSLWTPQAGALTADFGFPAAGNDFVLQWNGIGYAQDTFDPSFGWDTDPPLAVGDGFFVHTATTKTWTRSFTVQ